MGKQTEVFEVIKRIIEQENRSPSMREISELVGLTSGAPSIVLYIRRLIELGVLTKKARQHRSLALTGKILSEGYETPGVKPRGRPRKFSDEVEVQLNELYWLKGVEKNELMYKFDISPTTLRKILYGPKSLKPKK
jgi:SOS-response transcriptional repressor LexA